MKDTVTDDHKGIVSDFCFARQDESQSSNLRFVTRPENKNSIRFAPMMEGLLWGK